jgi:exosortase/archaeosortase family protein
MRRMLSRAEWAFLWRFLSSFFLVYAAIYSADVFVPGVFFPLEQAVAAIEAALLSAIGIQAAVYGATVFAAGISFSMAIECTSLVMASMLFCLLYATRQPAEKTFRALLLWVPVLFAFNLLRVLLTAYVDIAYGSAAFEFVHALLWFADSLAVVLIWMHVAKFKL